MSIFNFWNHEKDHFVHNIHPQDKKTGLEIQDLFNLNYPPGPYFGPLKRSKLVFLYGNPSDEQQSSVAVRKEENREKLLAQLKGDQDYPIEIPGWGEWFQRNFQATLGDQWEKAASEIAVLNLIPYASTNMDNLGEIMNCLPSTWLAQEYVRNVLIKKAMEGEIILVVCRPKNYWGILTSWGCSNILINNCRVGIKQENKKIIKDWVDKCLG